MLKLTLALVMPCDPQNPVSRIGSWLLNMFRELLIAVSGEDQEQGTGVRRKRNQSSLWRLTSHTVYNDL